ncbi:MAG: hypothetical protein LKI98_04245 [Bifidobacterium crudilactis]|jgi:hypothetical protein|nr:hypothetical protein [Bifidobacterium crudilactis]MCI1889631.1 hypothetical protein [Bifidobacterium crudilactis]
MSDLTVEMHTLKCDWTGCEEAASNDEYCCWNDYNQAVDAFAGFEGGGWYHDWDSGKDYCPSHWHWNEETEEQEIGPREVQR